jgi:preprotein translocase subunit SecE
MYPESKKKSWFGSKRIGWGVRPQTWQGYVCVLVFAAVLYAVVRVV